MNNTMKLVLKIAGIVLASVILIVGCYVTYVFLSYHRMGDMELTVEGKAETWTQKSAYTIVSYNIGFGAYESDYGFFMDGGKQSRAWSKDRLDKNLLKIADLLEREKADFYCVQEVDSDATRTYHVDERDYLTKALVNYGYSFAPNYDSPYLFYPVFCPHGASKSGIMTFSSYRMEKANRVQLPVESGVRKILDLDRCYAKSYIKTESGKYFVLYNFHLSAYTADGKIASEQLKLVLKDMQKEYEAGNYCLAAGDFNKDLLGDSSKYFGKADAEYTWAKPIPEDMFDGYDIALTVPFDENDPVPTCRNADSAYHKGQFVVTIDGFLLSPNIHVRAVNVINTEFAFSDHNPVKLEFSLVE